MAQGREGSPYRVQLAALAPGALPPGTPLRKRVEPVQNCFPKGQGAGECIHQLPSLIS